MAFDLDNDELEATRKMEKKEITGVLGTAYEINKKLVEENEKELTPMELAQKQKMILAFLQERNNFYFMLLCHEERDYTLFSYYQQYKDEDKDKKCVQELLECLANRGKIKGIDLSEDELAIEIWISKDNESFAYYFFPYDAGVIEI